MRTALGDDDAFDGLTAVVAGLTGALEDAMLTLKVTGFAAQALIILDATVT